MKNRDGSLLSSRARKELLRSAMLLEQFAECLKDTCTYRGRWPEDDPGAKIEYDDYMNRSRYLRSLCK